MKQPTDSSGIQECPGYVCRLRRSLYGAVQAGEIWGSVIHFFVLNLGFKQSSVDERTYFLRPSSGHYMILLIVVDDMVFASSSQQLINDFKQQLSTKFKIKLLGTLKSFIGWRVKRNAQGLYVDQSKYLKNLVEENNLSHLESSPTPFPSNTDLTAAHEGDTMLDAFLHKRYRSIVGGILYAAVCTRPDL